MSPVTGYQSGSSRCHSDLQERFVGRVRERRFQRGGRNKKPLFLDLIKQGVYEFPTEFELWSTQDFLIFCQNPQIIGRLDDSFDNHAQDGGGWTVWFQDTRNEDIGIHDYDHERRPFLTARISASISESLN